MDSLFIWTLLFLGNAALMVLWLHYVVRVFFGRCPHCGESRSADGLWSFISRGKYVAPASKSRSPLHDH